MLYFLYFMALHPLESNDFLYFRTRLWNNGKSTNGDPAHPEHLIFNFEKKQHIKFQYWVFVFSFITWRVTIENTEVFGFSNKLFIVPLFTRKSWNSLSLEVVPASPAICEYNQSTLSYWVLVCFSIPWLVTIGNTGVFRFWKAPVFLSFCPRNRQKVCGGSLYYLWGEISTSEILRQ